MKMSLFCKTELQNPKKKKKFQTRIFVDKGLIKHKTKYQFLSKCGKKKTKQKNKNKSEKITTPQKKTEINDYIAFKRWGKIKLKKKWGKKLIKFNRL